MLSGVEKERDELKAKLVKVESELERSNGKLINQLANK